MNILFFTHYFPPEGNAPATRVHEFCRRWVKTGHAVTVITGVPNVPSGIIYEGYRNRLRQEENVDGIRTIRVWTYLAPNKGTGCRIVNYLSYMFSAILSGMFVKKPDVIIATSPQFFCGWAGAIVSKLRGLPFILEVRDIWPESIVAVGAMSNRRLLRLLEWLELWLYAAADHIVTVGEGYKRKLFEKTGRADGISIIPNGVDLKTFSPREPDAAMKQKLGLQGCFVCSYVGTIGMASGLDVVLEAARILKKSGQQNIKFLLVGDGAVKDDLQAKAASEGLDNVVFIGRQDKARIPDLLALSDACLVHLKKKAIFETVMPSKIYEAAAMSRPIILGVGGHAAKLTRDAGAGICIEPENAAQLIDAVEQLAGDPSACREFGEKGRLMVKQAYDCDRLAREYESAIQVFLSTLRDKGKVFPRQPEWPDHIVEKEQTFR